MPVKLSVSPRHAPRAPLLFITLALTASMAGAQVKITAPKEEFGFNIGDDYRLANYTQFSAYWRKLDAQSDRMIVEEIGKTAEGRPQLMAIITSPANHRNLARYKEIARRLALAEGLSDEQARSLAAEGKAVVWIDGGLHATEVLGAAQLMETVHQLVSASDPETLRFLDDCIILAVHANPDGMELVSDWYMRAPDETARTTSGLPRLYQKYIGHDNNRDFYMATQPESENIARVQYSEWFPQIVYNHHQTGPAGAVMFAPPFRDPHNHNFDPLIPLGINLVGASMHSRFAVEGKPGAVMREGASYQTWWNGGLRTTVYFHNMIGLLTETIGSPTPIEIPFTPAKLISTGDYPYPIAPQTWRFRQSVEYSVTANRAVLDVASRHREQFQFNIYRMGKNSIERGSRDSWTNYPRRIAAVQDSVAADSAREAQAGRRAARGGGGQGSGIAPTKFYAMLEDPALRDPRGYVIPADQPDFLTATKFVNALIKNGVAVHRATAPFTVAGKRYPSNSYVVKTAQAFRPHVLDMFEPQDYPNDLLYPGGPPKAPYDNAGYTLAFQMGVHFDRILDGFDGPFERIAGRAKAPAGTVAGASGATGYLLGHQTNDAFIAINRLLANRDDVYWMQTPVTANGKSLGAGALYVQAKPSTLPLLRRLSAELGLSFDGVAARPQGDAFMVKPTRIALWDQYGGSMQSGWTRWLFEQFEFPFEVVYPGTLDAGNLNAKYDVIVFVDEAIPESDRPVTGPFAEFGRQPPPESIPAEFRARLGRVSVAKTVPQLRRFMENGGAVITIGSSTRLAGHLGLPVRNALVERTSAGRERALPREKLYVPGSVLQVAVDNTHPLAHGLPARLDVFFDNSPVFRLEPDAAMRGIRTVAWFDSDRPLRSGWAWGQHYLEHGVAVAEANVGKGKLFLLGPEVANRAQPHGTFKLLFNAIYYGSSGAATAVASPLRATAQP